MATTHPVADPAEHRVEAAEPGHAVPVPEAEMVAELLAGEWSSSRFGPRLSELAAALGADASLVARPDPRDGSADEQRRRLLGASRGWPDRDLFEGFPADTAWYRWTLVPVTVLAGP